MNKHTFLKNLLLGFLPLLIFVVADELLSRYFPEKEATEYALILAIGLGMAEALYIYIKEKRLEKMVLIDTGLIIALGGISLVSGNDLFFKLKPALVQFIMTIILGVIAFLKPKLLLTMTGRFMQGMEIQEPQLKAMQQSAQGMVLILGLHTLLIIDSALYLSKGAWAFVSGPLLYILIGLYFLYQLLVRKLRQKTE